MQTIFYIAILNTNPSRDDSKSIYPILLWTFKIIVSWNSNVVFCLRKTTIAKYNLDYN